MIARVNVNTPNKNDLIHFSIAALWYAFLGLATERFFWWSVDSTSGYEWSIMITVWSFILGGLLGAPLVGSSSASLRRILGIGVAIPIGTLMASSTAFVVLGAINNLFGMQPVDGLKQLAFSPLMGFVIGGSGLLVTFWIVLPVGVMGSWLLLCLSKIGKRA